MPQIGCSASHRPIRRPALCAPAHESYLNIDRKHWQSTGHESPCSEMTKLELESKLLFQAQRFRVMRLTRTLPDGNSHAHDVVVHPGAVVILPLIAPDRVCLIRNFRIAVNDSLVELPAGTIDAGEGPLETAHRELAEETGYHARRMEKLSEFFMSPGILNERMHLFLATELQLGKSALEQGEEIETEIVDWAAAMKMVENGEIHDAKSLVGLLMYDRIRRAFP
jgi:ADP-ribose pyrophosphatase